MGLQTWDRHDDFDLDIRLFAAEQPGPEQRREAPHKPEGQEHEAPDTADTCWQNTCPLTCRGDFCGPPRTARDTCADICGTGNLATCRTCGETCGDITVCRGNTCLQMATCETCQGDTCGGPTNCAEDFRQQC